MNGKRRGRLARRAASCKRREKFRVANPNSGVERSDKSSGVIRIDPYVLRREIAGEEFQRGAPRAQSNANLIDRF
jgi:hypothetical protein